MPPPPQRCGPVAWLARIDTGEDSGGVQRGGGLSAEQALRSYSRPRVQQGRAVTRERGGVWAAGGKRVTPRGPTGSWVGSAARGEGSTTMRRRAAAKRPHRRPRAGNRPPLAAAAAAAAAQPHHPGQAVWGAHPRVGGARDAVRCPRSVVAQTHIGRRFLYALCRGRGERSDHWETLRHIHYTIRGGHADEHQQTAPAQDQEIHENKYMTTEKMG